MKRYVIMLAGMLFPLAFFAQETPFTKLFEEYTGKQGYYSQEIIPSQMSMAWENEMQTDALRKVMNKISAVRILSTDAEGGGSSKKLGKSISGALGGAKYTELITVKTDGESVNMYGLKLDNGSMREFVLAVVEQDEVTLVSVTGEMDMSDILMGDIMEDMMKLRGKYNGKECPSGGSE